MPVPWGQRQCPAFPACLGAGAQQEQEVQQLKEKQHAEEDRAKKPVLCQQLPVIRQANPPLAEVDDVSVRIQALRTNTPELCSEASNKAAEPLCWPQRSLYFMGP